MVTCFSSNGNSAIGIPVTRIILLTLLFCQTVVALAREKLPGEDSQWEISPTTPRSASVVIRFEDPTKVFWPTYLIARSTSDGRLTMKFADGDNLVPQGSFEAKAVDLGPVFSTRHPRVLEPHISESGVPQVSIEVRLNDAQTQRISSIDHRGREKTLLRWNGTGRITVGEYAVPLKGLVERKFRSTNQKPYVAIAFETEIDGSQIGVKANRVRIVIEALAAEPGSGVRRK
jgi:hypothetical protein